MSGLLRRARALPLLLLLAACAAFQPAAEQQPPIVFVHGNGDTAALWHTTAWRFEYAQRGQILDFARRVPLPDMYPFEECVEAGGLMSYGVSVSDIYRRAAHYVDKILKGTNPAELPIEQPVKFDFVINLKTAKVLGITFPQSILVSADRLIE